MRLGRIKDRRGVARPQSLVRRSHVGAHLSVPIEARKAELRRSLAQTRERTLWLLDQVPDEFLKRRVHSFYSPIGWHFGHIGRTEEFWTVGEALGAPLLDDHLSF